MKEGHEESKNFSAKFSIIEDDLFRHRSHSCMVPDINQIANWLEFVPKLKPKKHDHLPSPMNLNAKGFRHLKKNQKSQFLVETNNFFLSCPEKDDIESDSTEETNTKTVHEKDKVEVPLKKRSTRKFMDEEKLILPDTKNYSREYEVILRKESIKNTFDKFELFFNEDEEVYFNNPSNKVSRFSVSMKRFSNDGNIQSSSDNNINTHFSVIGSPEDDYNLLKSMSVNFSEEQTGKGRANSILRLLEINIGEKRKSSNCDI